MKVEVAISCGTDERRVFISCGRGDKTFKWLGMVASQRYALSAPNGAVRRRDSDIPRGMTINAQQLPQKILIGDGESPHPGALINEYIKDGDVVRCVLGSELPVSGIGSPEPTMWSTAAFTQAGATIDRVDDEKEDDVDDSDDVEQESHAAFMRVILESQLLDHKRIESILTDAWRVVPQIMPRISDETSRQLCDVVMGHAIVLMEIFDVYAPSGSMDFPAFREFVDDAEFFSARDAPRQISRVFRRVVRGAADGALDLGGFLASLVLSAQLRHNDTLDEQATFSCCSDALGQLLHVRIPILAQQLNLDCLFRMEMCESENLYEMRHYHNDVFLVFDQYASKMERDLPLTLTCEIAAEILYQSGLINTPDDVAHVLKYVNKAKSGLIVGRTPLEDIDAANVLMPKDELTFAEFFETCCRIGVKEYLGKASDDIEEMTMADAMLHALQDVGECLTKPKPRKLPSPRPDERDRRGHRK